MAGKYFGLQEQPLREELDQFAIVRNVLSCQKYKIDEEKRLEQRPFPAN